jgi:hypothetical protein
MPNVIELSEYAVPAIAVGRKGDETESVPTCGTELKVVDLLSLVVFGLRQSS